MSRRLRHLSLTLLAGLCLLPALSSEVALQDMTSLLEGGKAQARWQAFFIPSPAGSIEKAELAFVEPSARSRLPRGAGLHGADGTIYTMDNGRPVSDSPDEARVTRSQKSGRVIAVTPQAPPKAFSAGSILERQSLLRPGANIGGADVRSAFARPAAPEKAIEVAMNFAPKRPDHVPDAEATVMLASLDADAAVGASAAGATALGYAPAESGLESRAATLFGKILKAVPKSFIPPLGEKDHGWAATPLPISAYTAKEQTCLATGIYFEARGEPELGQAAVAQVILNRVRAPSYPKSICGVVYQNKNWRNRCQFSFACDGQKDKITNKRSYSTAKRIAGEVTRGDTWIAEVGSATHYHATYVAPRWANAMSKVDKIGRHIFYRTFGGGWN
ncbi:cell wall hydrolase [Aureimonas glaciei]|uniref:Hydrolase n=1 Tax=Aureimonas glaciei TaxID=1776957 RepID=A0A916XT92_9HYPH|nr:cell wall hydrolase [Aureimonas glaciei]GGD07722.1 hydrolase [Aureimonas glaciei]